jgi:catechol 2,3-dioxygenase-like lactoylglutathione lyase family enzyme
MSAEERVPGPGLVPELLVDDLKVSVAFWCGLCGFEVLYDRPEEGFAYLASGTAHLMIEQAGVGRNWTTPTSPLPARYHLVSGSMKRGCPAARKAETSG